MYDKNGAISDSDISAGFWFNTYAKLDASLGNLPLNEKSLTIVPAGLFANIGTLNALGTVLNDLTLLLS